LKTFQTANIIRDAVDKDSITTILSDCYAEADDEVHLILTTKIFPRQADVYPVEECSKI